MTLIIGGSVRFSKESLEAARPAIQEMIAATLREDGCMEYCFAEDLTDPGLVRVFEIWRDQAAVDAHGKAAHMADFQAASAAFGMSDPLFFAYDAAPGRRLGA